MSIVDRAALESSPLADLHAMASELSIDGYRRLRRPELIDAILSRQEGTDADAPSREEPEDEDDRPEELPDAEELAEAVADELKDDEAAGKRRRRGRRGGRGRAGAREEESGEEDGEPSDDGEQREERAPAEETVEGVVELVPNGSGFVRMHAGEQSDDDVYISAAQVKRCE